MHPQNATDFAAAVIRRREMRTGVVYSPSCRDELARLVLPVTDGAKLVEIAATYVQAYESRHS